METTAKTPKEKLIEFIHNLTETECELIITYLKDKRKEQP